MTDVRPSRFLFFLMVLIFGGNGVFAETRVPQSQGEITLSFAPLVKSAAPAVVNIYAKRIVQTQANPFQNDPFFRNFLRDFGATRPQVENSLGSGVIVGADGIVVSNYHVVGGATEITVVLHDGREFSASALLSDSDSDLAVLKLHSNSEMPYLTFRDSETVEVGELVLAIGNPFGLGQTVTTGVVSALGRTGLGIEGYENFIQTDAAINPGNSGGALVNVAGELVGINTAIASRTGSYAGYGFAVPVNLMKKIVNDIMKYGKVQRAILGVSIRDIDQLLADEEGLKNLKGVYIADVVEKGAAEKAGIEKGDVVLKIEGEEVNSSSKLQEKIGKYRPGDEVNITIRRNGKEKMLKATLLSKDGETKLEKVSRTNTKSFEGMNLGNTTKEERQKLEIKSGAKVESVGEGVFKDAGIPEGFVITHINNERVYSPQGAIAILSNLKGAIVVEGKTKSGKDKIFAVKLPEK